MVTIRPRTLSATALASALVLGLSACAGSAGGGGGGASAGEGYAVGASQEEIDAALADLDPITITYQPSAASEASVQSPSGTVLRDAIEERSGGKITVDTVWGQAIAGYSEVHDALADGRVDLAYTLPVYLPQEFPAVNALGDALATLPPSPYTGEMITNAVATDVAWNTPEIVAEYEEKGLHPIAPVVASGGYYNVCADPATTLPELKGKQVRIASASQNRLVMDLGASPVSIEYVETFEALQRGTVDCTLAQLVPSAEAGIFEVAPEVSYFTDTSISRSPGALIAGSSFADLPLAYQQVIFDSYADYYHGQMGTTIGGNAHAIEMSKAAGGTVAPFEADVQDAVAGFNEELRTEVDSSGVAGEGLVAKVDESAQYWTDKVTELGFEDSGAVEDFDTWYDTETDFRPIGEDLYAKTLEAHRPS
ncbi:TRAP transporter substrate-binding protein DctP [Brevibacterium samyangense]|uniref:TRAP-type C4-dicarboxylate transport system, substrate-binding protein n=1 Tax=Brevibacterium samyangense TaxID=366888 RepID=A0ABN2T823_9MICO